MINGSDIDLFIIEVRAERMHRYAELAAAAPSLKLY